MSTARQPGHPSRRTNQSVSSTTSAASSRSDRLAPPEPSPQVETAVTRLLVSIKQLLEALTKWSKQEVSEMDVSDVYVRLGNDFNAAVAAFSLYRIEMSELASVPDDLRAILETCLSEDATPDVLSQYLPEVRKIITDLLQGLRSKQSIYRRIISDHKHRSSDAANGSDRESRSERTASRRDGTSVSSRAQVMRGHESSESSSRRSATSSRRGANPASPPVRNNADFVGGFAPPNMVDGDAPPPYRSSTPGPPPRSQLPETSSFPPSRARSASAVDATAGMVNGQQGVVNGQQGMSNGQHGMSNGQGAVNGQQSKGSPDLDVTPIARPQPQVPPSVKRYSLSDPPVGAPTPPPMVVVDEVNEESPSPATRPATPQSPPRDNVPMESFPAPAVQNSLAALKQSDALERRASKRFSTYNISKMTGGSIRGHGVGSNPNRRSLAVTGALTPGDLAVLTEVDEEPPVAMKRERSRPSQRSRNPSPIEEAPLIPPLPSSRGPSPQKPAVSDKPPEAAPAAEQPSVGGASDEASTSFPVFLQVGREVKKVIIEPPMTFGSLRVLFMDKFAYNPGKENFPAIYIRDPSSGVQYELEDPDEIKDKCLLSLNIEPLDQIKQHIDTQISSLAQDIKDLRAVVSSNRRASHPPPMIISQPLAESTPSTARPTERQFHNVARRLSRLLPDEGLPLVPQQTGSVIQPQMTGASVMSEYSTRVVEDLKTQFDEVQNLRRDLGIMRQLYTEFMKQTKESLGALRSQTQNVRQIATTKVAGTRSFINDGKAKLDSRSQNVLTRVEELQDIVENIKDDVLKRNVSPKPQILKKVRADMDATAEELRSLKEHIQTVKPMWKKTWEEELQNIVEEQQFLQHQEEFLGDLLEDHKAAEEVYGHVEKVISLRGNASARATRARGFKPPPMDEGHSGLSTQLWTQRTFEGYRGKREESREELQSRSDEFQSELNGFVSGKRLKMTGGAEEVERVRQKRNEQTLKAMFTGPSPNTPSN
ncbi:actin interacting protein 3-domain-containing protein [Sparassis latifolia]